MEQPLFTSLPSFSIAHPSIEKALIHRPRRNRQMAAIRGLVQETHLHPSQLIAPLFVLEGSERQLPIASMPGIFRYSLDLLLKEVIELYEMGIRAIDLFCVVPTEKKDAAASEATRTGNLLQQALMRLRQEVPDMCLMVDVALDPFTDHGHDGIVNERGEIDNDLTLPVLAQMSILAADAGAHIVAPSDMMDGRVAYIRRALDQAGHSRVGILSYAAKYASAFYGPFREALHSAPKFGDKKTYQMNPANIREALLECQLDEQEGADLLLIKPGLPYLDVIAKVKEMTNLPVGAYHVSGEYAMVMAAAQNGWLDANRIFEECLLSMRRAGADFILTYAARQIADYLHKR
ncbi:porphobilinogen synthase [Candidatus Protochlamydia phocaeensis]|uniref:porphobilinogen synthase n=1 Tax=Candidatus Protochlamydia phocaeensis TaxID=1414722 RepID=UPI0009ADF2DF|nr:porphobilinogen synthase [Candidatus Protochlamydia phocaeensis]